MNWDATHLLWSSHVAHGNQRCCGTWEPEMLRRMEPETQRNLLSTFGWLTVLRQPAKGAISFCHTFIFECRKTLEVDTARGILQGINIGGPTGYLDSEALANDYAVFSR